MGIFIDLIGQRFGRLRVIRLADRKTRRASWLCQCDCGNTSEVLSGNLRCGRTRSCGCLAREVSRTSDKHRTTHGHARHGRVSREYYSWRAMLTRCSNPNHDNYPRYGGRGIHVCERWLSFDNFLADMGPRPKGTSLHRKNEMLGYFKDNCVWATTSTQGREGKSNIKLTESKVADIRRLYDSGVRQSDIAEQYKIAQSTTSQIVNGERWAA